MDKMLIGVLLVTLLLFGCTSMESAIGGPAKGSGSVSETAAPGFGSSSGVDLQQGGRQLVIKTGNIRLLVPQGTLEDKYARLRMVVSDNGGDVSGVSYNEYETEKGYSITAKIEPKKFENALAELKKLGEVKSVDTNLDDVSNQYVDLELRISNLNQELEALNSLYNRTDKIEDVLKIRNEITATQTQLEMYKQQKLDLDRRIAKSTISIYIYEEKPALDKNLLVPLGNLAEVFFGALGVAITIIVALCGFLLPAIIVGLLFYGAWKLIKRKKAKD